MERARAAEADYVHPTYVFQKPISPHLAAREEGVTIDFEKLRTRADDDFTIALLDSFAVIPLGALKEHALDLQ